MCLPTFSQLFMTLKKKVRMEVGTEVPPELTVIKSRLINQNFTKQNKTKKSFVITHIIPPWTNGLFSLCFSVLQTMLKLPQMAPFLLSWALRLWTTAPTDAWPATPSASLTPSFPWSSKARLTRSAFPARREGFPLVFQQILNLGYYYFLNPCLQKLPWPLWHRSDPCMSELASPSTWSVRLQESLGRRCPGTDWTATARPCWAAPCPWSPTQSCRYLLATSLCPCGFFFFFLLFKPVHSSHRRFPVQILAARPEDGGTYVCTARNNEGTTETKVEVVVQGGFQATSVPRPSVPEPLMLVVEGETATLRCEAHGNVGSATPRHHWTLLHWMHMGFLFVCFHWWMVHKTVERFGSFLH